MEYNEDFKPVIGDICIVKRKEDGILYKARITIIWREEVQLKAIGYDITFKGAKAENLTFVRPKRWYEFWV